jgi:hypothetical protein
MIEEQAVLGAILKDSSCFETVYEILTKDSFFEAEKHRAIYKAMISLYLDETEIDLVTLRSKLKDKDKLDLIGGSTYLVQLTDYGSVANAEYYANEISKAYRTRAVKLTAFEMSESDNLEVITSKAEQILELSELNTPKSRADFKAIAESHAARKLDVSSVTPPVLFRFLKSVATHAYSNFPIEATFTHLLSIVAGLAGSHFCLIRDGRPVKTILSSIVSMDSSVGKSENLEMLIKPIENKQKEYRLKYLEELKTYNKTLNQRKGLREKGSELDPPEKPIEKTILTTKATTEVLIRLLSLNPNGILYAKDEISGVFSGMNEYKRGQGSDKDTLLELLAGQSVIKHTVSSDSEQAYGARLSLTGGIQPAKMDEWLRALSVDDGFWGRFIFFTERNNYTVLTPRAEKIPIDLSIISNFYEAIIEESQSEAPVHFAFEDESQIDCVSEYLNDEKNESPNSMKNYIGKCFNFFQRIAVVLHLINCHYSGKPLRTKTISSSTTADAFLVTAFYIAQAKSLFISDEQTPKEKLIKAILAVPLEARTIDKLNTTVWRKHDEGLIFKDQKKKAEKLRKIFEEMEQGSLGTIIKLSKSDWQFIAKGEKHENNN